MRHRIFALSSILSIFCILSCSKQEQVNVVDPVSEDQTGEIVLGSKLDNPYSISGTNLKANAIYVRFQPKDSLELGTLESLGLDLFEYPLDYEILKEGDHYHDPNLRLDQITWQYTVVQPGFDFQSFNYEILDSCFVYNNEAGIYPHGKITIENDSTGEEVPVQGVKVRCHYFVKIASAYTDADGNYNMSASFPEDPRYSIVFQNADSFEIWGDHSFQPAFVNLGKHNVNGCDKYIKCSDKGWKWGVINNAAYEYYKQCAEDGIMTPPSDLKIWCWPDADYSSTPMLSHISTLSNMTKLYSGLPDITVGMSNKNESPISNYAQHCETVNHELNHASHFSKAGAAFWSIYILYIVSNKFQYGDSDSVGKVICELGESWAYANERIYAGTEAGSDEWFADSINSIYKLMHDNVLTRKEIFDCLTSDTVSISMLKSKLLESYPAKATEINACF